MTRDLPPLTYQPIEGLEACEVPFFEWLLETIEPPTGWEDTVTQEMR